MVYAQYIEVVLQKISYSFYYILLQFSVYEMQFKMLIYEYFINFFAEYENIIISKKKGTDFKWIF